MERIRGRILHFVCTCGLFFAISCASERPILFGLYAVPKDDLLKARSIGIDFVVGPKTDDYLQSARAANLKVLGTGPQFPNDSVLLGNYLRDEPDLFEIAPELIAKEYAIANARSQKPAFLNLSSAYSFEYYSKFCDVLMFDWYPIGWQPIETFYANLRTARLAAGKKPFFATVQTFDWARYPSLMRPNPLHRKPTPAEVQAMAIWAAMNGAAGIAFYPFDDKTTRLADSPELLAAVRESVTVIRHHQAFFLGSRIWSPYPFKFSDPLDQYNSISETSIAVSFRKARDPGELLVVASNTTPNEIEVAFDSRYDVIGMTGSLSFKAFESKFLRMRRRTFEK